ncbi:MAG: cysteine desulfurase [Nitrosomonadales bacterium]|jgi:cysteine desulfurase|nr:cysteine desulfurase [Nitrosomonadales bacterium]MBT4571056.1 cysteine desulfurase [Nitrosomonadales bacterium]MBT4758872.1 cysteine desulfurase [Nitrosomonadales bacterium]MBT6014641.1 cysteine desulfurase [Nitrosomonadales bacterium]MBT6603182.1 cysteine desulfurase [Nitrosomonadales bacterium]
MIYFDNNATTALHPEVLKEMLPFLTSQQGNPASNHTFGRKAHTALEEAREKVAASVNAHPSQVIFTSSGTESNNTIINGIAKAYSNSHFGYSSIEHPCISEPIKSLVSQGYKISEIPVDSNGIFNVSSISDKTKKSLTFLSVMMANNETGVIQNIAEIADWSKKNTIQFHTDAVQALGKIKVDFEALDIDAMTISSHKIYGPQGVAALIVNKKIDIIPYMQGGGQEKGLRSGTENIAAIIGFGKACERSSQNLVEFKENIGRLRLILEKALLAIGAIIFCENSNRLSNTTFFSFKNIDGSTLLTALDRKGFAIASGSACSSNSSEPSHVLLSMGVDLDLAQGALRISLGLESTEGEVNGFIDTLKDEVDRLRQMAAVAA